MDTLLPGKAGGRVDAERLTWLDTRLAEASAKPTMIFMHHPPFKTAIEYRDGIGLEDADTMSEVVHDRSRCPPRRGRSRLSGAAGVASWALPCRPPAGLLAPAGARYGSGGGREARAEVTGGGTRGPRNVFSTA
jgi:hypothetical protein